MENKDLEKLFRNKLESLVMEPSAKARDTFARDLRSANRRIILRKISIAAAILLLLSSGTIFILQNDRVAKVSLTDKEENRVVNEKGTAFQFKEERNVPRPSIKAGTSRAESDGIQIPAQPGNERAGIKDHPNGPGVTVGSYNATSEEYLASSIEAGIEQNTRSQTGQHDGDMDPVQSGLEGENRHIEYYIETQGERSEAMITSRDPVKITIEYKASESNKEKSQSRLKEFYSRIDNVKGMDEVIGDIRTYKDRLFTLDFKNREKVNNDQ